MNFRQIVGVLVPNVGIAEGILSRKNWIVVQARIFEQARHRIHTESRDPLIQPEPEHVIHCFSHFRISPIQVGLLDIEMVVIPLARLCIKLPCPMSKPGLPVVRRFARPFAIAPNIPIALGIVARGTRLLKPGVLV